jgi:uncharacterized protein YacL
MRGIIFRIISGLLIAGLFRLVSEIFPNIKVSSVDDFLTVAFTIVGFGVGVYGMPVIASFINKFLREFTEHVTKQVVNSVKLQMEKAAVERKKKAKESLKKKENNVVNPVVVDTSALIDGRIKDVAETGFFSATLLVPKFVLSELQHIADSPEALRRGKGRRGLDILNDLKKLKKKGLEVKIVDDSAPNAKDIDGKLIEIAKMYKGKVLTVDYNLNKVANASNVVVLNVNELSNAIKAVMVPGDRITLKVVSVGKEPTQGVGYLEDGTMIVVENGASSVGKTVNVEVSRFLQTVAGRMIFAQVK